MKCGIVSYGTAIPHHRIAAVDIWKVWENVTPDVFDKMSFSERCVLMPNEDAITLGVAAGELALERSGLDRSKIGALIFGSCTNPYATKASATVIQDALALRSNIISYDLQFGGKSGTTALIAAASYVEAGFCEYALVIASDTLNRHFQPGVQMEYSGSAAAFAAVIGKEGVIASLDGFSSFGHDLSDYFRVEGERYIQLGGGWLGYVSNWGLLESAVPAGRELLDRLGLDPEEDFDAAILPQATGVQPLMVGGSLGFDVLSATRYVLTSSIGDCGAAGTLVSLARFLDFADPDERVFLLAYGYGSGADALVLTVTEDVEERRPELDLVDDQIENKQMVDYAKASKYEFKYIRPRTQLGNYM